MDRAKIKTSLRLAAAMFFLAASVVAQAGLPEGARAYKDKNYPVAIREFEPLAESGNAVAQFYIGLMLENGQGLRMNTQLAMDWYLKSANQGYAPAQNNLGVLYEKGTNVELSNDQAAAWYLRAAQQGYAPAQFNLGLMYYIGHGNIRRDHKEAASWYLKAAEQGYALAQNSIGKMYENGQGQPVSLVQAYKWYILASDAGNELAQMNKRAIEDKMAPDMSDEAKALAREWLAQHKK